MSAIYSGKVLFYPQAYACSTVLLKLVIGGGCGGSGVGVGWRQREVGEELMLSADVMAAIKNLLKHNHGAVYIFISSPEPLGENRRIDGKQSLLIL